MRQSNLSVMGIRFHFDWTDAQPSPDSLSCHTMAAFSIEAGGANGYLGARPFEPFLAGSRRRLSLAEPEQVDELGHEYGVSTEVIRRQIENHGLAAVVGW